MIVSEVKLFLQLISFINSRFSPKYQTLQIKEDLFSESATLLSPYNNAFLVSETLVDLRPQQFGDKAEQKGKLLKASQIEACLGMKKKMLVFSSESGRRKPCDVFLSVVDLLIAHRFNCTERIRSTISGYLETFYVPKKK